MEPQEQQTDGTALGLVLQCKANLGFLGKSKAGSQALCLRAKRLLSLPGHMDDLASMACVQTLEKVGNVPGITQTQLSSQLCSRAHEDRVFHRHSCLMQTMPTAGR